MPTYEYHCNQCDTDFEYFQKMSDAPLKDCIQEGCGGKGTVKRLIGAGAGLIFKGSGFYITDYKNGGGSKEGEVKKTEECKAASGDGGSKSDACPCAAPGATKPPCTES